MKKKILFLSILCLLFVTLSYTYSSFNNTIVGTITANVKDWVFKVSVNNGTIKDGGYNLHLSGTSGSFNININTNGSKSGADYTIELIGDSSIKFYKDSSYTKLINNNIYRGFINNNTSSSVTIYYKSDTAINSDILIKTKGTIMEIATMKNGGMYYNSITEFWSDNYKPYIRIINFDNDLSNLPSSCTKENLCWDISETTTQKKKVYGYLVDTGLKDSTDNTKPLYNLYIVSEAQIFAPSDCTGIFSFYNRFNITAEVRISNLIKINFNGNFNTSNVTEMDEMFRRCSSLTNLDLSSFNTANVKTMYDMFSGCKSLATLDLSNFNTANVINMGGMFDECPSLTSLNLSNFNTSNVEIMSYMFSDCSSLTNLYISNFDTSNVIEMVSMFKNCSSLTTTINLTNGYVYYYRNMFSGAATNSGSQITVNYIASAPTLIDNMIATKSSNSNVIKGSIIPECSITITGDDDIKYESINRLKGTKITLTSISGNNYVTSFKMNGTTINGNEFIMPDNDVTISDIVTTACKTIETAHYPYSDSHSQVNVILGEHTFEGAKSLTVILDYETYVMDYFRIYDSSSSTTGINNDKEYGGPTRTQETITINSNYIKITFKSLGSVIDYYGLKAIIIPNY